MDCLWRPWLFRTYTKMSFVFSKGLSHMQHMFQGHHVQVHNLFFLWMLFFFRENECRKNNRENNFFLHIENTQKNNSTLNWCFTKVCSIWTSFRILTRISNSNMEPIGTFCNKNIKNCTILSKLNLCQTNIVWLTWTKFLKDIFLWQRKIAKNLNF